MASAIACLHVADIQHCDLKPDNIFFGRDGDVRVADFGTTPVSSRSVTAAVFVTPNIVVLSSSTQVSPTKVHHGLRAVGCEVILEDKI